jgi:transposase-like protein
VPKHSRRLDGFDEAIISLYAKGLTTGEIQSHLDEIYGAEVSKDTISRITDAVNGEALEWQNRPLDALYNEAIFPNTGRARLPRTRRT